MERYGRHSDGPQPDPSQEWTAPGTETGLEEPMWQLGLGGGGGGTESYPERPDEADCIYYLRTGFCGYGARCRFNHPRDRAAVIGAARAGGGEYPERVGQPVCQYYMRTGTCKFGASCKYHHPRQGGESVTPVSLNYFGYPLRPGEKECSYYVKTGQCKFGATCKFHHPQPAGLQAVSSLAPQVAAVPTPVHAPTLYQSGQSSSQQYGVVLARPPLLSGSYVQNPYPPMIVSPGMVPFTGWSHYPGAPPCTHYAQRGVCKFGSACKFDHPVGTLSYSPSASSLTDVPVAPYPVGSSIGTLAPSSSSSELRPELISGSSKDSVSSRMSSSMSTSSGSIGSTFSQGGPTPHSTVQQSAPGSGPSSGSSNGSTEPRTSN
ncbi:zinc finger CCCH domain-containing protein 58 isoform X2 [Castanea sativa]|uniref:zinc finger CCCH domain-containing protein 58 isoform X2 n=1 Tax=Castanea sativa TaxID=21020 RepID=UPI003F64BB9D